MAVAGIALTLASLAPTAAQAPAKPSFDCAKATGEVEKMICQDPALAALDVQMAAAWQKALGLFPPDVAKTQRALQNGWIRGRNDCWKEKPARACVETSYQNRLFELQLESKQLKAPIVSAWACTGGDGKPVTMSFYNDATPQAGVLKVGDDKMTLFAARSGSGARYASGEIEFWEHQGEASITWWGTKLACKAKR